MIVELQSEITERDKNELVHQFEKHNASVKHVVTQFKEYYIVTNSDDVDLRFYGSMTGVKDIFRVDDPYKFVSKKWKIDNTVIHLGDDVKIGDGHFQIMAGPCSIESEKQIEDTVAHLVENGIRIMRGGVYKPRSSPYSFRGLGIEGLKLFYKKCHEAKIKIITEVMQVSQIEQMYDYVDVFQVGARNAQNFNLLDALGQIDKPVLLKRGISGSLEELLQAAEYVFSNGNEKIMLCERGIRTFEKMYRNTLDINAIPILKAKSHLPVIVDPSHGIGIRDHVEAVSLAAIMAGADGLIVEAHPEPEIAFSDGKQTLNHYQASLLYCKAKKCLDFRRSLEYI
jgi:3-deoxy-7-phosphoheptulonate synthase